MFSFITFRARIAAAIFLVVGGLVGVASWQLHEALLNLLEEQVQAQEQVVLNLLKEPALQALATQDYAAVQPQLARLARDNLARRAVLADREGLIVASDGGGDVGRPLRELRVAPDAYWRRVVIGGTYTRLGTLALEFSGTPLNEARENARVLGVAIAAAGMIIILLVALGTAWLLTRRLDRLRDAAQQMAEGNLAARAGLSGRDEVAAVSRAFDLMAQRVAATQFELMRLNRALEHRVQQRTIELSKALDESKRMQDQLVQAEKLAALGSLVAGVSHEINTPLGISVTAVTYVDELFKSLQERLRSGTFTRSFLDEFIEKSLETNAMALANLQRAAELIRNFKMVAVDQSSAKRREFMLRETLREIISTLRPMLKNRGIDLVLDVPDGITMDSYPGPLGQVITNLFSNALLHAFEGRPSGRITIKVRSYTDNSVAIYFSDDGGGIAREHLGRIFDPFFTTKGGEGGSGLGLSIVYNIVTAVLGGSIAVESRPHEGTTFTITLPRVAPRG